MDSRIEKRMRAALIVEAVRQSGNDAEDLRDAAHEAAHVFQLKTPLDGPWERPLIHSALTDLVRKRSRGVANPVTILSAFEYQARAVEMLVCRELEIDYELDEWTKAMLLETSMLVGELREHIGVDVAMERIRAAATWKAVVTGTPTTKIVKRVLALGER